MLNHEVLLSKLGRYGICGICKDWFRDYLANRSLRAKVQTSTNEIVKFEKFDISYGTAQGSCLGPLLFILFTNDIYLLSTFSKIILFAADTTLINSSKDLHFLQYSLEHDMMLLTDWYQANQLSLNVTKTVLIKFWSDSNLFSLKIDNVTLSNTKSTKFLGITIDECLTWNEHVGTLHNKLQTNKRLLLNARNLLPPDALLKIYYAHVYSHLMYGILVWGSMIPKSSLNSLYSLQKQCIKLMARIPRQTCANPAFKKMGIIRLRNLIDNELCKLGYKLSNKIIPKPLISLFQQNGGIKTHKYETRHKNLPNIQKHTTPLFNQSFLCKSISLFSRMTSTEKSLKTIHSFSGSLKWQSTY